MDLIGASASLVRLCVALVEYIQKTRTADFAVDTLRREIEDLHSVLSNISESIQSMGGSSVVATRTNANHWQNVDRLLRDCRYTLENLNRVLQNATQTTGGFLRRAKLELRLDWSSKEISLLQRQIVSCRQAMELSLQMIIVYLRFLSYADAIL